MTTIRVPIGPAADAVQRVAVPLFFGDGHPNYPVWQSSTNGEWLEADIGQATHAAWDDHRLSAFDAALCGAIAAAPERIPSDTSALDRAGLEALYPEAEVPE